MVADLKPAIDSADIDLGLHSASCLIGAAMDLLKQDDGDAQFFAVDAEQIWHVLFAADARLCKIREEIKHAREEA